MKPEVLKMLVCPIERLPLDYADGALLAELNQQIAQGTLQNRGGKRIEQPLAAGLIRSDRQVLYPIVDQIPLLLADEGILLSPSGVR